MKVVTQLSDTYSDPLAPLFAERDRHRPDEQEEGPCPGVNV